MPASFQLLDCTLRDGGYYNAWDFDLDLVKSYLSALNQSGVKLVELGYKSLAQSGFYGLYKYCPDSELAFLKQYSNLEFAFMLDVKEFLDETGRFVSSRLDPLIAQGPQLFTWCRLAATYAHLSGTCDLVSYLFQKGFKTTVNLMGCSLLNESEQVHFLTTIAQTPVTIFYFADTFGNFLPTQIAPLVALIKTYFKGEIGFHPHNNQELAYANTLAAIEAGVTWIDGTVLGMGRGAGNLKIESMLLSGYAQFNRPEFNPFPLLDVINTYFVPLQNTYQWGSDFAYMLSGIQNIHPSYCQNLKSSHQFQLSQVSQILNRIPVSSRSKYQSPVLLNATDQVLNPTTSSQDTVSYPTYKAARCCDILILANGPQARRLAPALQSFIAQNQPLVIECNHTQLVDSLDRITVFLNTVRLDEFLQKLPSRFPSQIILGATSPVPLPFEDRIFSFPYSLKPDHFEVGNSGLVIPHFLVGMYALGLALLHQPKTIYLAGFDGNLEDVAVNDAMNQFWQIARKTASRQDCDLVSLLPTAYSQLPIQSIFSFLGQPRG